jgi:cytochrome c553
MQEQDPARRMTRVRRAVFLCCGFVAAGAVCAQSKGDAARGAARAAACVSCHGAPGRAPLPMMPSLDGQMAHYLELQLVLMREGLRDVPQMADMLNGLSDRDMGDVAAYFAAQKPPPPAVSRDAKLHARGAALAKAMICGNCHGDDYRGQKHVPRLASQREDYLALSLRAYRDSQRTGIDTSMNGVMYQAADSDIRALAHYLAHLP